MVAMVNEVEIATVNEVRSCVRFESGGRVVIKGVGGILLTENALRIFKHSLKRI